MLLAFALAVALPDLIPMRWFSAEPSSLELLDGAPVNCLLLEREHWRADFLAAAKQRGLSVMAVIRSAGDESARELPFDGFVFEGHRFVPGKPSVDLPARRAIRFDSSDAVIGTSQGVWPGIELEHPSAREGAPTGSAWINTNIGFLRFARAASKADFWMDVAPPRGVELTVSRYAQAIADAAAVGARWVITLDAGLASRLLKRETAASEDWRRIREVVRFYEDHREWRRWPALSELAMIQDVSSGGLITGNLLDMLSVMNTPVRAVPPRELSAEMLGSARVAVTLQPQAYTAEQRDLIASFAAKGGKVVTGPGGWKMPLPGGDRITFDKKEYRELEAIWPELHSAVARKNFGVRLFNVTGTLSHLQRSPDGRRRLLHLINYTDYPVESITAFVQGAFRKATLLTPQAAPRQLATYRAPEGTAVEIDKLDAVGAIVLE